jgi:hypothetical protein
MTSGMSPSIKKILERVSTWPEEEQEALAEFAAEIEARRTGVYVMNDSERAAVNEGLQQIRRGDLISEREMEPFWKRFGVA